MDYLKSFGIDTNKKAYQEEIVYSTALLYNLLSGAISDYLRQYQLTIGKFNVLMTLRHQAGPEGIRQVEMSKHLIVTPANMTKMVDKLEEEGLAIRSALPGDRRVNIIRITSKGSELLDDLWPGFVETLQKLTKALSGQEQERLAKTFRKWISVLEPK